MKLFPDFNRRLSNDAPVATGTTMKRSPTHAGPTQFSLYCKEHNIDGAKARRRLRANGLKAPYDPNDSRVIELLKQI